MATGRGHEGGLATQYPGCQTMAPQHTCPRPVGVPPCLSTRDSRNKRGLGLSHSAPAKVIAILLIKFFQTFSISFDLDFSTGFFLGGFVVIHHFKFNILVVGVKTSQECEF
ncbi:hypothetical protein Pan189_34300 [Stratiformator vulcanicus]|uniref:Uncharacterized protein n=1 Tax=Stratiformator vulcanicus TaxID=2527980 RepID=A0A517R5A8_9PLAN|nr:hypothetical protein Pan189_34300 [Stratiformator vulcanicus]